MTIYTETLSITVPVALASVASKIGRALDPDVGGADSFHADPGGETVSVITPCTPAFKQSTIHMLENPQEAFEFCQSDYAQRWPELAPPRRDDVLEFCSVAIWF